MRNLAYGNNHPNKGTSYDQRPNQSFKRSDGNRSRNGSFNNHIGTGETIGTALVLHRLKGETHHKVVHTTSQEGISVLILLSEDLTIDLRPGLHPTNKNFHKTTTRPLLMWFASPQPTIPKKNYQTSVR